MFNKDKIDLSVITNDNTPKNTQIISEQFNNLKINSSDTAGLDDVVGVVGVVKIGL